MATRTMVDITGLDKVELLHELWKGSRSALFFKIRGIPPPEFDAEEAKIVVTDYIDYFDGRMIKCDISGNQADPGLYDRDFGAGAFQRVVNSFHPCQ